MRTLVMAGIVALLLPGAASAHALGVDYRIKGDRVEVETYYDDDTAAVKAKVKVVNDKGETIALGLTDKDGRWSFKTPPPGKYKIHADAGAGHVNNDKTLIVREATSPGQAQEPAPESGASESREEMTSFPWLKVGFGLMVIGMGSGAVMLGLALVRQGKVGA